jgi:hypothetical protein
MHTFVRSIHRYERALLRPARAARGRDRHDPRRSVADDQALLEIAPIVVENGHERVSWAVSETEARALGPSLGMWCGTIPTSIYPSGGPI